MVSPTYKGGFGASHIEAVAQNGEGVVFYSPGVFAGAPSGLVGLDTLDYLSRRGVSGWSTVPMMPPDGLAPYVLDRDVSSTLGVTLALGKAGSNNEAAFNEGLEEDFLLHSTETPDLSANWEIAGIALKMLTEEPLILKYDGADPSFCHLLFINTDSTAEDKNGLLEKAVGTTEQLYELARGCGGAPVTLRLVALNGEGNVISPKCKVDAGVRRYALEEQSAFNEISTDGSEVFFTTCINNSFSHHQLFVRLAGEKTLEISKSLSSSEACGENEIPCKSAFERPDADFVGASEDGAKVYFTTAAPLGSNDKDAGNDLYMATIGCSGGGECATADRHITSLVQVSQDPTGEVAVQGVVRVAPDGSRIYFVANGNLLSEAERQALQDQGLPLPQLGAENLYVYNSVLGETSFIGDLCSGPELSGSTEDLHCPSKTGVDTQLWASSAGGQAQTAGLDGKFLVFTSYGQLVGNDTDATSDIYRYDAETDTLIRVSAGETGYDANGNSGSFDSTIAAGNRGGSVISQNELNSRTVSENGSQVIFTTAEPLSPAATNHLSNLYEWDEKADGGKGEVSLVSSGDSSTPVEDAVLAPGGNDVFFVTTQGLVPQDTDGAPDVYDARLNGGFQSPRTLREPCSGDACQGPLTNPSPLLVPGSVTSIPGENFAPLKKTVVTKSKKSKVRKKSKSKKPKLKAKAKHARRGGRHVEMSRRGGQK